MIINKNSISVIIPMYNSANSIIDTLKAIVNQTAVEYIREIIVVNDGSKDNCGKLVEEFSNTTNITIRLINKVNGGVSSARNLGIEKSTGEWIAFCDSDDSWLKDKIEIQVRVINESGINVDFIGGNHFPYMQSILWKPLKQLHKMTVEEICIKSLPQTSTILMKKDIVNKIGYFDVNQSYAEDGNFILRAIANFDCYYSPVQMVYYGNGKRGFGESGLSGNTKAMHLGELKNIKDMLSLGYISRSYSIFASLFCWAKYFRRLLILLFIKVCKK